jgi:cytoskeletal protein CcmA (bactofilin family)
MMLNFNRNARENEKDPVKPALRPAPYNAVPAPAVPGSTGMRAAPSYAPASSGSAQASRDGSSQSSSPIPAPTASPHGDKPQSTLSVGVNIKLKGVEISDCDALVIEGHVEATVHSKAMEIAKPGTLKGTAMIDVAEIHGEFSGELTARTRLVVHGTGRVSGTIRYGKLIVAEGGEIRGDVNRLDDGDTVSHSVSAPSGSETRRGLNPPPGTLGTH